jgi:iron only hydrogenase large subunit-like protein
MTFNDLYREILKSAAENDGAAHQELLRSHRDRSGIDCLLHPERYAPVLITEPCDCEGEGTPECVRRCIFSAIRRDGSGALVIDRERCVGCGGCIDACASGKLTASRDVLPVLDALKNAEGPVYAMTAPAVAGQFGAATVGQLRSAFKALGFAGMVEVALFADILTLKEALDFSRNIKTEKDTMLTSCCCPIWIAMVRRSFAQYMNKMPDAVSPMVACARAVKRLEPSAVTVFIGPCLAKKAEARERDIAGAVDFVLTFEETRDIFDAFRIDVSRQAEDGKAHSSRAGRLYGRTGGVSEAVGVTVRRLDPRRVLGVLPEQADGTARCLDLLQRLKEGRITANYLEGMGCEGGCVGGPKVLLDRGEGRRRVEAYGKDAAFETPLDNPYVLEVLKKLEIETIEGLLDETIFTRRFEELSASGRRSV